jgi:hypothetical protein
LRRLAAIAAVGLASGVVFGILGTDNTPMSFLGAGLALAAGLRIALAGARAISRHVQVEIATWWLAMVIGIMFGVGAAHPDPVAVGALGWLCSSAAALLARRRAEIRTPVTQP